VSVGDAPGATTYWWLSTLSSLAPHFSGRISSDAGDHGDPHTAGRPRTAANNINRQPSRLQPTVLTHPGSRRIHRPQRPVGAQKVTGELRVTIFGLTLSNTGTVHLK